MDHSPSWPHLHGRDQPNCSISHDGSDGIGSPSVVENVECLSGVSAEVPSEDFFADDETGFGQAALDHSCRGDTHGDHIGFAADDSFHVSVSSDSLRVGHGVWNQMVTSAFHQFKCLPDNLKLPWEQGVMSEILGPADFPRFPEAVNQPFSTVEDLGFSAMPEQHDTPEFSHMDGACFPKAVQNVRDLDFFDNKRRQLDLACAQWLDILSTDWECSSTGLQLALDLQEDPSGDSAVQTLRSVFGVKSPATLLKRAATVRKYLKWYSISPHVDSAERRSSGLPFRESDVWQYFLSLRAERERENKGFTVTSNFLETVRFTRFALGFHGTEKILESRRLLGFAAIERRHKGPSHQAPPLELEHLQKLHEILRIGDNLVDRLGAGVMLVCAYARARWSDLRYIHHVEIERSKNGCMVLYTREHKTCAVGERREQYLPLIVPWHGVTRDDWITMFLDLYSECGLDINKVPLGPLLPAPKMGGGFCARPLATEEASKWLRLLLAGCAGSESLRSHSLECTLLIWSAKAGMDKEVRAVLGYHCSALSGSEVVYSRHLQARAMRKLQMLLHKVRIGLGIEEELAPDIDCTRLAAGMTPRPLGPAGRGAPMTPAPSLAAAATPTLEVPGRLQVDKVIDGAGNDLQDAEDLLSVKDEAACEEQAASAADELSLFSAQLVSSGVVEIESSSGSDSSSTSDSYSSDECSPGPQKDVPFVEVVPEGFIYYKHKKSLIMHKCVLGENSMHCKTKVRGSFAKLDSKIHFKYPKCLRCFTKDSNRIRSIVALNDALDGALSRAKKATKSG